MNYRFKEEENKIKYQHIKCYFYHKESVRLHLKVHWTNYWFVFTSENKEEGEELITYSTLCVTYPEAFRIEFFEIYWCVRFEFFFPSVLPNLSIINFLESTNRIRIDMNIGSTVRSENRKKKRFFFALLFDADGRYKFSLKNYSLKSIFFFAFSIRFFHFLSIQSQSFLLSANISTWTHRTNSVWARFSFVSFLLDLVTRQQPHGIEKFIISTTKKKRNCNPFFFLFVAVTLNCVVFMLHFMLFTAIKITEFTCDAMRNRKKEENWKNLWLQFSETQKVFAFQ